MYFHDSILLSTLVMHIPNEVRIFVTLLIELRIGGDRIEQITASDSVLKIVAYTRPFVLPNWALKKKFKKSKVSYVCFFFCFRVSKIRNCERLRCDGGKTANNIRFRARNGVEYIVAITFAILQSSNQ